MLKAYLASRLGVGPEAPLFVTAAGQRTTHKVVTRVVHRIGERIGRHLHSRKTPGGAIRSASVPQRENHESVSSKLA